MSTDTEAKKAVKPRPVARYFGAIEKDDKKEVERVSVDVKKKPKSFEGDVINVETKAKPFGKTKWNNQKGAYKNSKHFKNRKHLQLKVDPYALQRHSRGAKATEDGVKTDFFKDKIKRKEVYYEFANEQAARTELLLNEEEGFLTATEKDVRTAEFTQKEIVDNVDITSASKHFNLNLDFGPYRMRYTRNGRHLLIGGKMGHIAAFDWVTKRLHCELNVMEEITDITWLHLETMFAVAQKNWVHFYDNQGVEIHCVKAMHRVTRMEFLPYHFLIASGNDTGYLCWLDVTIGEIVAGYHSKQGPIRMMAQNPFNGVLCLGGSQGVVTMWSPTVQEPLAKILCHPTPLKALAVDPKGTYLATSGVDKSVKIWDIRALSGPVVNYKLRVPANELTISQKGLLALGMDNLCEVYKKPNIVATNAPYLRHHCGGLIHGMQFCPYEDVLGVSTRKGFTSLLVPGSGEPNFDSYEANPYQTKSQRRENEVHKLLDKIPPEFIKLNPDEVLHVDVPSLRDNIDAKKALLYVKAPEVNFKQRNKMKGKGGSANAFKAKRIVRDSAKRKFVAEVKDVKKQIIREHRVDKKTAKEPASENSSVLDRFKAKKRT